MHPIIITHIIAVETLLLITIIKTVLLWLKKESSYNYISRLLNWPVRILFLAGISTGIYMFRKWYGFNLVDWLALKFAILLAAMIVLLVGEHRKSRWIMTIACIMFFSIIVVANMKQQFFIMLST